MYLNVKREREKRERENEKQKGRKKMKSHTPEIYFYLWNEVYCPGYIKDKSLVSVVINRCPNFADVA